MGLSWSIFDSARSPTYTSAATDPLIIFLLKTFILKVILAYPTNSVKTKILKKHAPCSWCRRSYAVWPGKLRTLYTIWLGENFCSLINAVRVPYQKKTLYKFLSSVSLAREVACDIFYLSLVVSYYEMGLECFPNISGCCILATVEHFICSCTGCRHCSFHCPAASGIRPLISRTPLKRMWAVY
jgi:hypothetical protein